MDAERFIEFIKLSRLLDERTLEAFLEQHPAAANARTLALEFVAAGLLTPWQADMLLSGHRTGFSLGRYKLLSHLGDRSTSTTYLAIEPFQQRRVAIKLLSAEAAQDPKRLERFRFQATVGMGLDDTAIIKIYDLGQDGHTHFMVQEYVPGKNLARRVAEQGPLAWRDAVSYVGQMALGLKQLHRIGLLHRNLRPEWLLVGESGVKIMGFEHSMAGDLEAATHALGDSEVAYIADYMAPEYADTDMHVSHRADLYSLGCVLCFLLTGEPPFPHGTLTQRLVAHRKHRPPNLGRRLPQLPRAVVDAYEKLLAKDPADRFQSGEEVFRSLWPALRRAKSAT